MTHFAMYRRERKITRNLLKAPERIFCINRLGNKFLTGKIALAAKPLTSQPEDLSLDPQLHTHKPKCSDTSLQYTDVGWKSQVTPRD